jgi:L-ascorbate metabolism protein UlaG (beta-lactamase superfamily)
VTGEGTDLLNGMKKFFKGLLLVVAVLAVVVFVVVQTPPFGGRFDGARLERMRRSPQWIGGRFENTPRQDSDSSWRETWRLYRQGQIREPRFDVPVVTVDLHAAASKELKAIWLGHSSVVVELDGVRILTDPVLSDVASPLSFIGPRRLHRAPVALGELTNVDAVVISHDHYDHLDMKTVQQLAPRGTHFFVPLGIGAHLERWNVPAAQIHELDWWESAPFKGLTIHCTPARHYSSRKKMDNSTLWASWLIRGAERSVYYSGDTGYSPHFQTIRQRLGSTDLDLIKVGA